jgi:hypothetical protein
MGGLVQALFAGKMDADVAAQFAKLSMKDPQGSDAAAGKSEAEVAAEIQQAFNEALASTDLADTRRELDAAMGDLKSLISAPRRPWWKIW